MLQQNQSLLLWTAGLPAPLLTQTSTQESNPYVSSTFDSGKVTSVHPGDAPFGHAVMGVDPTPDAEHEAHLTLSPGLVEGPLQICVTYPQSRELKVELLDLSGWVWRTWFWEAPSAGKLQWVENLEWLPNGIYFLKLFGIGIQEKLVQFLKV